MEIEKKEGKEERNGERKYGKERQQILYKKERQTEDSLSRTN
jgi:hypothetical protein